MLKEYIYKLIAKNEDDKTISEKQINKCFDLIKKRKKQLLNLIKDHQFLNKLSSSDLKHENDPFSFLILNYILMIDNSLFIKLMRNESIRDLFVKEMKKLRESESIWSYFDNYLAGKGGAAKQNLDFILNNEQLKGEFFKSTYLESIFSKFFKENPKLIKHIITVPEILDNLKRKKNERKTDYEDQRQEIQQKESEIKRYKEVLRQNCKNFGLSIKQTNMKLKNAFEKLERELATDKKEIMELEDEYELQWAKALLQYSLSKADADYLFDPKNEFIQFHNEAYKAKIYDRIATNFRNSIPESLYKHCLFAIAENKGEASIKNGLSSIPEEQKEDIENYSLDGKGLSHSAK